MKAPLGGLLAMMFAMGLVRSGAPFHKAAVPRRSTVRSGAPAVLGDSAQPLAARARRSAARRGVVEISYPRRSARVTVRCGSREPGRVRAAVGGDSGTRVRSANCPVPCAREHGRTGRPTYAVRRYLRSQRK